ncbi:hypothetical protein GGX14DRAFT_465982 [Mycena pura]|uniref:Nephrocystin 3-like N-terminal domain-containing protein n=1 Tax=Mycena pura TaxID=153505 RepID=A0AAD6V3C6_9AGAR|nr:hypothetical protein GGX14DRAFT_465982 [Mycena pura]
MAGPPQSPKPSKSLLGLVKYLKLGRRSRSPSPQPGGSASHPQTPDLHPTSGAISTSQSTPVQNPYLAVGSRDPVHPGPLTHKQHVHEGAGTVLEGLRTVFQALYDCSDVFPPLKTATAVFLSIFKNVDTVRGNKKELEELQLRLTAIITIVKKYEAGGGTTALNKRITLFCEALEAQMNAARNLQTHSVLRRTAEGVKDAGNITKALRDINSLCEVFQIDTQQQIEGVVEEISVTLRQTLQLTTGCIERLRHETTSYKTRHSSYGDPSGCMPGTRTNILEDLEAWASDDSRSRVYWLSTIAQSFCEILDRKNMLGASFFCSRVSEQTKNAHLIIPTIAYSFAIASPSIQIEVVKAIEADHHLAETTYFDLDDQFRKLIYRPIRASIDHNVKIWKIVVLDALDECTNLRLVAKLIQIMLESAPDIALKKPIREAFNSIPEPKRSSAFYLHEVENEIIEKDIEKYLKTSLTCISERNDDLEWPSNDQLKLFIYAATALPGNYRDRLSNMTTLQTGTGSGLKTAAMDDLYGQILQRALASKEAYEVERMKQILATIIFIQMPLSEKDLASLLEKDISPSLLPMKSLIHVPITVFHASFPDFMTDPERCSKLPALRLVPSESHAMLAYNICGVSEDLTVSRRESTNPKDNIDKALRYGCAQQENSKLEAIILPSGLNSLASAARTLLSVEMSHTQWSECRLLVEDARRCLKMNFKCIQKHCFEIYRSALVWLPHESLIRRIYARYLDRVGPRLTVGLPRTWGLTEAVIQTEQPVVSVAFSPDDAQIVCALRSFRGPPDLEDVPVTIQVFDASTGQVQRNMKGHTDWVNTIAFSPGGDLVVSGSEDTTIKLWSAITGEMRADLNGHTSAVTSVAFSADGSTVVSGSEDRNVKIWNTITGRMQANLIHTDFVNSVAFSPDGRTVISGARDGTVKMWDAATTELRREFKDHSSDDDWRGIKSVAFSRDGSRVVSADNCTISIWNVITGRQELRIGVPGFVTGPNDTLGYLSSVTFSSDGRWVIAGLWSHTIEVWNAITGEMHAKLKGHSGRVFSLAVSSDGSRIISGAEDCTIRIWNMTMLETQASTTTMGESHAGPVTSISFSRDGSQVVSGSEDKTARVWNARTGRIQVELKGHRGHVSVVAFSPDGSQVITGDRDTVRIWNSLTGVMHANFHFRNCRSIGAVALSEDGSHLVCASSEGIWICNTATEKSQLIRGRDLSAFGVLAFSQDGRQIVCGSRGPRAMPSVVWILEATTGKTQARLTTGKSLKDPDENWLDIVDFVAFSQDGSHVVSGSSVTSLGTLLARTIQIWDWKAGTSIRMTTPSVTLSDQTEVYDVGRDWGMVQIVYPAHARTTTASPISVSDDFQWIMGPHSDCWIPYDERISSGWPGRAALSWDKVAFGYKSGRVMILDMACTVSPE